VQTVKQSETTVVSATGEATLIPEGSRGSWYVFGLRSCVAALLTTCVVYLALAGDQQARAAVVASFGILVGALWGERSALKRPGMDT